MLSKKIMSEMLVKRIIYCPSHGNVEVDVFKGEPKDKAVCPYCERINEASRTAAIEKMRKLEAMGLYEEHYEATLDNFFSPTNKAKAHLEAIKGFTELGSGFKIAMRDLSIRGAGNILGASQSGFIDSVGFEMYSQLLEAAIEKKQGKEKKRQKGNAELNLQIDAYIPSDYISDERQKIEIYKRIREIQVQEDYELLQDELIDRFGEYPDVVAYLLEIGFIKSYLDQVFVKVVDRKDNQLTVKFEPITKQLFLTQDYFAALSATNLKARIAESQGLIELIFDVRNKKDFEILEGLRQFGEKLLAIKQEKMEKQD